MHPRTDTGRVGAHPCPDILGKAIAHHGKPEPLCAQLTDEPGNALVNRGEVGVILINHGHAPFAIEAGMKIAQLVVSARIAVEVTEVAALQDSERGAGGFGSTGMKKTSG